MLNQTKSKGLIVKGKFSIGPIFPFYSDLSDTTTDMTIKHGAFYQLKVSSLDGNVPKVVAGTPDVVAILPRNVVGQDHYIYLCAVGAPGTGTGIYINGSKAFVVNVK